MRWKHENAQKHAYMHAGNCFIIGLTGSPYMGSMLVWETFSVLNELLWKGVVLRHHENKKTYIRHNFIYIQINQNSELLIINVPSSVFNCLTSSFVHWPNTLVYHIHWQIVPLLCHECTQLSKCMVRLESSGNFHYSPDVFYRIEIHANDKAL